MSIQDLKFFGMVVKNKEYISTFFVSKLNAWGEFQFHFAEHNFCHVCGMRWVTTWDVTILFFKKHF